jgi:AcrR family transcriptional regulator
MPNTTPDPPDPGRGDPEVAEVSQDPERGLPPGVALAWGLRPVSTRGPKPGLSLERIVEVAVDLADQGGLAAVSMARIAEVLGFTTMSLYRYVRAKDELMVLMGEAAFGVPPGPPDPSLGWREAARQWGMDAYRLYAARPWMLDLPIDGPPMTPNQLRWLDWLLQGLAETGLDAQTKLSTTLLIDGWARNFARLFGAIQPEGLEAVEGTMSVAQALGPMLDPATFPALAPMVAAGEFDDNDDPDDDFETVFTFGLERILDGVAVLVDRATDPL